MPTMNCFIKIPTAVRETTATAITGRNLLHCIYNYIFIYTDNTMHG